MHSKGLGNQISLIHDREELSRIEAQREASNHMTALIMVHSAEQWAPGSIEQHRLMQ